MSYDHNQQRPAPNSFHDSPHHHEGDSRPPSEYPQQGNPSQAGAPDDLLDGVRTPPGSPTHSRLRAQGYLQQAGNSKDAVRTPPPPDQVHSKGVCPPVGNLVQGQTSPKNLHQRKPSPVIPFLDTAGTVVQCQTSPGNLQQGKPSIDVPSLDTARNVVQGQTSLGNLQQGKPSTDVPSLDTNCVCSPARNVVQGQTLPGNLQKGKPSTNSPSLVKVVKHLEDSSGPVGGPVPGYPLSSAALSPSKKETSCIRKCLAAFSPCCG